MLSKGDKVTEPPAFIGQASVQLPNSFIVNHSQEKIMIQNVGSADKIIRLVLGVGLGAWVITGIGQASTLSYVGLAVSVILIATALINFCPLFRIFGISTKKSQQ